MLLRFAVTLISLLPAALGFPQDPQADATTTPVSSVPPCKVPEVRREWRTFSNTEKANWINAIKCLSHLPHSSALAPSVDPSISKIPPVNTSSSYYDDFVYVHMDLNVKIHFTGLFLPWHRWYVYVYTKALREKCGYKGVTPYWDWTKDAHNFHDSPFFQDSSPVHGLGGWGDPNRDFQLQDGAFSEKSDFKVSYPSYHSLRRNFTLQPYQNVPIDVPFFTEPDLLANTTFTQSEVTKMVTGFVGDFKGFQKYFEAFEGAHGSVHLIVGGDLAGQCPANAPAGCTPGPTWSANSPLFWLHHGMVDKVWYDWQHANPENRRAYFGGSVQMIDSVADYQEFPNGGPPFLSFNSSMPTDGLFSIPKIGDVIDTTSGLLCYVYQ